MSRRRVLVLCSGNSCRSQMAEGLWRHLAGPAWEVHSAGSRPTGVVHPLAIQAMAEIGIEISGQESKPLERYRGQHFDLVVTVCDQAAQDCPVFPGAGQRLHWPVEDPAAANGSQSQRLEVFRRVRDRLRDQIVACLGKVGAAEPESSQRSTPIHATTTPTD